MSMEYEGKTTKKSYKLALISDDKTLLNIKLDYLVSISPVGSDFYISGIDASDLASLIEEAINKHESEEN